MHAFVLRMKKTDENDHKILKEILTPDVTKLLRAGKVLFCVAKLSAQEKCEFKDITLYIA